MVSLLHALQLFCRAALPFLLRCVAVTTGLWGVPVLVEAVKSSEFREFAHLFTPCGPTSASTSAE